jgi:GNAT superfamily N-acetyltransferase
MVWRLRRAEFEKGKGDANRQVLHDLVAAGAEPGVLAYAGGEPIGWCAVAPRADYSALERSRVLAPVDDSPVWSITCLYIARAYRRRGVSVRLLEAATQFAQQRGARIVEGYPVEPYSDQMPAAFAWTGLVSAFRQAGFREVLRRSKTRPIMRCECNTPSPPARRRTTPRRRRG